MEGERKGGERQKGGKRKDPRGPPISMLPSSDFQVPRTETVRLPTLKEVIRYQSNDYANARSSVYLKLFPPDASNDIDAILLQNHDESSLFASENSADSVLVVDSVPSHNGSDDNNKGNDRDDGLLTKIPKIKGKGFSFGGDDVRMNDVRDNIDNEDDDTSANEKGKIRIDRSDDSSTTTTFRPTTMHGPPLVTLLSGQVPRGFYVTKSDRDDISTTKMNLGKIDNDTLLTRESASEVTSSRMEINEESEVKEERLSLNGGKTRTESVIKNGGAGKTPDDSKEYSTTGTTMDVSENVRDRTQKVHRGALKFSKAPTADRVTNTSRSRGRTRSRGKNRSATKSSNVTVPEVSSINAAPRTAEILEESTSPASTSFGTSVNVSDSTVLMSTTTIVALSDSSIPGTIASSMEFENTTAVLEREVLTTTIKDSNTEFSTTTAAPGTEFSNTDAASTTESLTTMVSLINNVSPTVPGNPNEFESTIILKSTANLEQSLDSTEPSITEVPVVPTTFADKEYSETDSTESTNIANEYVTGKDENLKSVEVVTSNLLKTTIVDQDLQTTTLLPESLPTTAEPSVARTEKTTGNINKGKRRQRIRVNASRDWFGEKNGRRGNTNRRVVHRPSNWSQENRKKDIRRRVIIYRGRKRRPDNVTNDTVLNDAEHGRQRAKTKSKSEELGTTTMVPDPWSSTVKINDEENLHETETDNAKRLVSKELDAKEETTDVDLRDPLRIEEYTDKHVTEVTPPRTLGGPLLTRLRKPASSTLSPINGLTNSLIHQRNIRPTDAVAYSTEETLDTTEGKTETPRPEKDLDQSSRAQEVAVTLAVPPTSESSGRVPLKETLRRRISTTLSPRSDFTTSRSPLRHTTVVRNRQKARAQDRIPQNVTTRPRRPPVRDYDYYEDEEERVVGKSSYNGKLFLTSKGTVRCLDQGNFPHPYSCKKFITCARMVNGQVIGAEYTCPDKLSFDPVGGICNWSAGLGCKE